MSDVTVEILAITVHSRITPSLGGKPVPLPNWEPDIGLEDDKGSQRPGVFEIGNQKYKELAVKINVTGLAAGETATLIGEFGEIVFTGTIAPAGDSGAPQTVMAVPTHIPTDFTWVRGEVDWYVETSPGKGGSVRKTLLELFWIYGYPGEMYTRGVWIEVLRLLGANCYGLTGKEQVIQQVVNYIHFGTGLMYDSYHGLNHYVEEWKGGSFKLNAYLRRAFALCNCYDLGGALQTLLAALGINDITYIYLNPFGYINRTNLIGRGQCNNPFFFRDEIPAPKVVEINDPQRSGFSNHVFCGIRNRDTILDACAGPHLGNETKQQYLDESIDTKTTLYTGNPEKGIERPGTIADMVVYPGVTSVGRILISEKEEEKMAPAEDLKTKRFKTRIGLDKPLKKSLPGKGVVCRWADPLTCSHLSGWKKTFEDIRAGSDAVVKDWILNQGTQQLRIEIFVANTAGAPAEDHLVTLAASTSLDDVPFDRDTRAPGHLHLVSNVPGKKNKVIWLFHNVCFLVDTHNSPLDLAPVIQWLQQQAEANVKTQLEKYLPVIQNAALSSGQIAVDAEVDISVQLPPAAPTDDLLLDFYLEGQSLRLVAEEDLKLKFIGMEPGATSVYLVLANRENLLSTSQKVTVDVV
ncbi:MAG: hypothetical protein GY950_23460 [bacterium]|nr:hypothetical protein [bacterium]